MKSFLSTWPRLLPFIVCLVVSAHAWSQNTGDSGQWQILQARYGTLQHNIDVTQRLRELARSDTAFRLTNDLFGRDPHPNAPKTLRIYALGRGGAWQIFEYAEGQVVQGTLFTGWSGGNWGQGGWSGGWGGQGDDRPGDSGQWQILQARYGTAQRNIDVTQQLRELARGNSSLRVGNDLFGSDPHPGVVKSLRIHARGAGGATRSFDYAEGQVVQGTLFSGWSDGNWGQAGGDGRSERRGSDSGW